MNKRTGGRARAAFFLIVSMGAAISAVVLIYSVITDLQTELERDPLDAPIQVMVAAQPISQGQTIGMEHLKMVDMPANYVPTDVLLQPSQVVNRVPRERILASEFIRPERLADASGGVGLPALVPRGMRAISIDITGGSAVSGFLDPGNYVDVLVTFSSDQVLAETVTLLQAVTVLAVESRIGQNTRANNDRSRPSVTLVMSPEQAEKLAHAMLKGQVTLSLRNDIDITHVMEHGDQSSLRLGRDDQRLEIEDWKSSGVGDVLMIRGGDRSVE